MTWTDERLKHALDLLASGLSLRKAAAQLGITAPALTRALRRHKAMPERVWTWPTQ